ncbi:MAG: response regulator, partial [Rhodocyclaceae bacterium]|nr:response regulator [Rhodocyclaceae bacterium]
IDAAKGRMTLQTATGEGLGIYIRLPLATVFIPSVLVREGNQTFAISSHLVIRHFEPGEEIIHENAYHTPLLLSGLLGRRPGQIPPEAQHTLLLRSGARILALRCSEFVASREILLQNAGPQLARIPGIQGAALLPDDTIAIAINPFSLIQSSPLNALPGDEKADGAARPLILIVDDSITVRSHTARTLERAGYQSLAASNGEEALTLITRNRPALILSDIEMPRMDGFVLLKRLRAQGDSARIPIVMISSRTAEKHRSRAAELGANHYLGKPFNEAELLQTIRKLLAPEPA